MRHSNAGTRPCILQLQLQPKQFKAPCGASLKSRSTIWLWSSGLLELTGSFLYSLHPMNMTACKHARLLNIWNRITGTRAARVQFNDDEGGRGGTAVSCTVPGSTLARRRHGRGRRGTRPRRRGGRASYRRRRSRTRRAHGLAARGTAGGRGRTP